MANKFAQQHTPVWVDYINGATKAAVLVGFEGREIWIPRSQIFEGDELGRTPKGCEINVAHWFAKKEGLL
jgi:hypothetical protein